MKKVQPHPSSFWPLADSSRIKTRNLQISLTLASQSWCLVSCKWPLALAQGAWEGITDDNNFESTLLLPVGRGKGMCVPKMLDGGGVGTSWSRRMGYHQEDFPSDPAWM